MEYIKNWKKSLNISERFSWATKKQQQDILAEISYQRKQGQIVLMNKFKKLLD